MQKSCDGANATASYITCPASETVLNLTEAARIFYLLVSIVCILGTVVTVAGNGLFAAAMVWHARRLTLPQKLLLTLAATDLAQGITLWPLVTTYHVYQTQGTLKCVLTKVTGTMGYDLVMMTVFAILTITVEQFLAVAYPFLYERFMTVRKAIAFFAALTIFHALANYLVNFPLNSKTNWLTYQISIAVGFFGLTLVIGVCQTRVLFIASAKARAMSSTGANEKSMLMHRVRAGRTTLVILIAFVVAYIPFTVYAAYIFTVKNGGLFTRTYIHPSVEVIALCNSAVNPIVYYWRLHYVRTATRSLLRIKRGRTTQGDLSRTISTPGRLFMKSSQSHTASYTNGRSSQA